MDKLICLGIISSQFKNILLLLNEARLLGVAHPRPWQSSSSYESIRYPGDSILRTHMSIDILETIQYSIAPQSSGIITLTPIVGTVIFINHCISSPYIHAELIQDLTLASLLKAKLSFECMAATFYVHIRSYHAENGIFYDPDFRHSCNVC